MRAGAGTKSALVSRVTRATKSIMALLAARSFQEGRGSGVGACAEALVQPPSANASIAKTVRRLKAKRCPVPIAVLLELVRFLDELAATNDRNLKFAALAVAIAKAHQRIRSGTSFRPRATATTVTCPCRLSRPAASPSHRRD